MLEPEPHRWVCNVQAILAAPMGVVHLMDMMTDMEALRNEVLLLLIGLTHANQSIQQIAAFEGAFERLLNIVRCDMHYAVTAALLY